MIKKTSLTIFAGRFQPFWGWESLHLNMTRHQSYINLCFLRVFFCAAGKRTKRTSLDAQGVGTDLHLPPDTSVAHGCTVPSYWGHLGRTWCGDPYPNLRSLDKPAAGWISPDQIPGDWKNPANHLGMCKTASKHGDTWINYLSRWWFQFFFSFTPIWGRFPFWLIFFRWVETTN